MGAGTPIVAQLPVEALEKLYEAASWVARTVAKRTIV